LKQQLTKYSHELEVTKVIRKKLITQEILTKIFEDV